MDWIIYHVPAETTPANLHELINEVIERVQCYGLCVIPEYYTSSFCEQAIAAIQSHEADQAVNVWRDAEHSDVRIMGIEALRADLDIRKNALIEPVISALYGQQPGSGFVTSGHLHFRPGNQGSGGGWHRDSVHRDQFKALVYLTDVTTDNGPFQYYVNTFSEQSILELEKQYAIPATENRISCDPLKVLPRQHLVEVCGPAGTLVIVNTRAIHRGKPIITGERFSLTSYHWKGGIPAHIDKLVNKVKVA